MAEAVHSRIDIDVRTSGADTAKKSLDALVGSEPLRRYATGGIANSPQIAMFGEGSRPEAYVPLPDGRRIPVAMDSPSAAGQGPLNIEITNNAAGVEVVPRMTPQGVALIVQEIGAQMIKQNNRQLPGMLSDAQRRGNR